MTKEFVASNGFTVREHVPGLAVTVDELYIGQEHVIALHEYFDKVNAGIA